MALSPNKFLPLARLVVLGSVSFLALVTLALSAHVVHYTTQSLSFFFSYAALGVAVSVLTLVTLPAMLFIGRTQTKIVPTFIVVELGWTSFLWVMWLSLAGSTASINFTGGSCGDSIYGDWSTLCAETNAIEAFGFLNWLMLLTYFCALMVFSIKAFQAGNKQIWTSSVNDTDFEASSNPNYTYDKNQQSNFAPQYPPTNYVPGAQTVQTVPYPQVAVQA